MPQRKEIVVMEYDVIDGGSLTALRHDVNEAIKKGWKLQGGVSIWTEASGTRWAQAMVRDVK